MSQDRKCLAAFTTPGGTLPPYINASENDGLIEIILRGPGYTEPVKGYMVSDSAMMKMTREEFRKWLTEALANLG